MLNGRCRCMAYFLVGFGDVLLHVLRDVACFW